MEEKKLILCDNCHFEYDSNKHAYCPNCNEGKDKKDPLIRLSEVSVTLPLGGRLAILLTSCYSIFTISQMTIRLWFVSLGFVVLYLAAIYLWFEKKDIVERPIWFLILLTVIYTPVVILITMLLV